MFNFGILAIRPKSRTGGKESIWVFLKGQDRLGMFQASPTAQWIFINPYRAITQLV